VPVGRASLAIESQALVAEQVVLACADSIGPGARLRVCGRVRRQHAPRERRAHRGVHQKADRSAPHVRGEGMMRLLDPVCREERTDVTQLASCGERAGERGASPCRRS
jgi:hypothetical protein